MNRKTRRLLVQLARAIPGLYPLLAFMIARRVMVRGWSMYPELRPGDRVLCDRLAYWGGGPRRGEVVLAVHPARPGLRMVKRVGAVPGDAVPLEWAGQSAGTPRGRDGPPGRLYAPDSPALGRDEYWLLGDAPDASTDSRALGPVRRRHILARAWLLYWPLERWRTL